MSSTPPPPSARPARYDLLDAEGVADYWRQQALRRHGPGLSYSPSTPVPRAERYRPVAILEPQQREDQARAIALLRSWGYESWYADDTVTWRLQPATQFGAETRETCGGSFAQLH